MFETEITDLIEKMLKEIKTLLGVKWNEVKIYAESETKKFGQDIADIAAWKAQGKIDEEQAQVLIRMHQRSMKMVFTACEGISLVLAEHAINSAIAAVRETVNRLIGWNIL
ncbi:MAG TPA: hypothetical protein VF399_09910 [bacterium]